MGLNVLLIVYDNESYMHWFPQGLAYIASALRDKGHNITVYNQDVHHYPESHLTKYLNENHFDMVLVSVIGGYYQYNKLLSLSKAINYSRNRDAFKYIIGGHGVVPDPQYFINKTNADIMVMGEGEITICEVADAIEHRLQNMFYTNQYFDKLSKINGIAYKLSSYPLKVLINKRRELIKDVNSITMPAYDLFPMEYYRLLRMPNCKSTDFIIPMLSGRGCTHKCNFCYRMDKGFRPRSNESIIAEIKHLKENYGITYIAFSDELLMSSKERTRSLCQAFIDEDINVKWDCNGRLNFADKDTLQIMKDAGCVFINYGVESIDDTVLKNMNKNLTAHQINKGLTNMEIVGISAGVNMIFGNIGDTKKSLCLSTEFLKTRMSGSQMRTIRPVTPYPGTELFEYCVSKGLIKDVRDFYENLHKNSDLFTVNLTDMNEYDLYQEIIAANHYLTKHYYELQKKETLAQITKLYSQKDASFRGFRQT